MPNYSPPELLQFALDSDTSPDTGLGDTNSPLQGAVNGTLAARAIREGLGGLIYRRIKGSAGLIDISEEQRQQLKQIYYAGVQKNVRLLRALTDILELVNAAGIRVVLLQGVSLLNEVYPDIGQRSLTDIDLWVLPQEFETFASCMLKLGYRTREPYPQTFVKNSTIIDVHTHFLWADRIQARSSLLRLDQETIFNDAEPSPIESQIAYRLTRTDQFIYLGVHCLKHYVMRMVWLADIFKLIDSWKASDWVSLRRRAEKMGQTRTVQHLLFLLEDLAGFRLPQECRNLQNDRPLKSWEKAILRTRRTRDNLPTWAPLVLLPANLNLAGKFSFIFENLFPKPPVLRQVFNQRPHLKTWQLYGLRAMQLVGAVKAD